MNLRFFASIGGGQDGAIREDTLFRFGSRGGGYVYNLKDVEKSRLSPAILEHASKIALDAAEIIVPHCNSVCFGTEFASPEDEFPLLYCNVYNNYAKSEDPLLGMTCVYRILKNEDGFATKLVQLIQIGFTEKKGLWLSAGAEKDTRPYGNVTIDCESGHFYAFVMRDGDQNTRYFSFALPKLCEGEIDPRFGVPRVVLCEDRILDFFDAPYHNYIQGACCHGGLIYSVEGFGKKIHPAIRIIDPAEKKEIFYRDLHDMQLPAEAELIDFHRGNCLYGDARGNLIRLDF
ncbi:MAG: hypothetical protein IKD31_03735 [Clostridia bacterium]|nr:hypothetical protein [Clostridia bacterium]